MLTNLFIQNFAIIQEIDLQLKPGLTTFTGETGAGKSILLDALEVLTGGRTDNDMVRSGADTAVLEAVFSIPVANRKAIHTLLSREELLDDENEIVITREIRLTGRNVGRINGHTVSTSIMRELGSYLVDIHGQSEHLSLLKVKEHIHLLDRFCDNFSIHNDYQKTYHEWQEIHREMEELKKAEADAARQQDLLTYQIGEIEAANLKDGEEEDLQSELTRLANSEKLATLCQKANTLLESSEMDSQGILDMLGEVSEALTKVAAIDATVEDLSEQSESILTQLDEVYRGLQSYIDSVEYNPKRLDQVETRLSLINSLKRKYGDSIAKILSFADEARTKLDNITHAEERIEELSVKQAEVRTVLTQKAVALSENRKEFALLLGKRVEAELDDLKMAGVQFKADIEHIADVNGLQVTEDLSMKFDESGIDKVEFLIAPNPGEGLKPLVKTASGGETSRLMLALKNVLAKADTIPTLIFDEIDQGIGGRIGAIVGEKLWQLSNDHQVLCVTHLPQLAAFGIKHYHVSKKILEGRTITIVKDIDGETRVQELANMYGGNSEANREAAMEALWSAKERISELNR